MLKTLKKAQQGFTIIELLIVIAIIAILAGLVLNNFQGAQAKARDTQRVTDINNVHSKLEEYYNDNNAYPALTGVTSANVTTTFPGIDAQSWVDPRGGEVTVNAAVADATAATAVNSQTANDNYLYVPYPTSCTNDCNGYVLKSFIEKPTSTTPNPYVKLGLNNL